MAFFAYKQKIEALEHRMYTHQLHKDPSLESLYNLCEKKAQVMVKLVLVHLYYCLRDLK